MEDRILAELKVVQSKNKQGKVQVDVQAVLTVNNSEEIDLISLALIKFIASIENEKKEMMESINNFKK